MTDNECGCEGCDGTGHLGIHGVEDWCGMCDGTGVAAPAERKANETFEKLADEFYRETGLMAPGKDVPAAEGGHGYEARSDTWFTWLSRREASPRITPEHIEALKNGAECLIRRHDGSYQLVQEVIGWLSVTKGETP